MRTPGWCSCAADEGGSWQSGRWEGSPWFARYFVTIRNWRPWCSLPGSGIWVWDRELFNEPHCVSLALFTGVICMRLALLCHGLLTGLREIVLFVTRTEQHLRTCSPFIAVCTDLLCTVRWTFGHLDLSLVSGQSRVTSLRWCKMPGRW